jgi:Uma2 family endonuclease
VVGEGTPTTREEKRREEAGVQEYWIVFPSEYVLQQFILNSAGKYELKNSFAEDEIFTAHIFPELEVDLKDIFVE